MCSSAGEFVQGAGTGAGAARSVRGTGDKIQRGIRTFRACANQHQYHSGSNSWYIGGCTAGGGNGQGSFRRGDARN